MTVREVSCHMISTLWKDAQLDKFDMQFKMYAAISINHVVTSVIRIKNAAAQDALEHRCLDAVAQPSDPPLENGQDKSD